LRTRTLLLMLPFALVVHFTPACLALDQRPWQYDFFPALFVFFLLGCLSYRLYTHVKHLNPPRWTGFAVAGRALIAHRVPLRAFGRRTRHRAA
jgi:hypothetical protein